MIAPTDLRRKRYLCRERRDGLRLKFPKQPLTICSESAAVTRSLAGIIIPPHFCPPNALLNCEKKALRWPGPFDSGFLSPQPPGVVGIGPSAEFIPILGQRELVLFFWRAKRRGARSSPRRLPPAQTLKKQSVASSTASTALPGPCQGIPDCLACNRPFENECYPDPIRHRSTGG
jgi:hypothetical protein